MASTSVIASWDHMVVSEIHYQCNRETIEMLRKAVFDLGRAIDEAARHDMSDDAKRVLFQAKTEASKVHGEMAQLGLAALRAMNRVKTQDAKEG